VDPDRALGIVAGNATPAGAKRLNAARKWLRNGRSLDQALATSGLLRDSERWRVMVALEMGQPERALETIADELVRQHQARAEIVQRLLYPGALVVVALVTTPLPALAAGSITAADYVLGLLIRLGGLAGIIGLACRWGAWVLRQARDWQLRFRGKPTLAVRQGLCRELGELLEGGVAAERAFGLLQAVWGPEVGRRLARARPEVARLGVVAALDAGELLDRHRDKPALAAAEAAGRLAAGLAHQARLLADDLDRRRRLIGEWVPRLVYCGVIIWVATRLLSGGGPGAL